MARKTSLPGMLDAVEREAVEFLREHEPPEGYQLCFSGGKDSIVMRNLADIASVKYQALFNCTTIDPPPHIQIHPILLSKYSLAFPEAQLLRAHCGQGACMAQGALVLPGTQGERGYSRP